jgi:DNA-binding Lrp family transcriptional regulator
MRPSQPLQLDDFDRKILALVQRDALTPLRELAQAVNLSAPAVQRRLQRLRENGVILKSVAVLDAEKVGRPITLIVEVEVESERKDLLDSQKRVFLAAPEVQQCYYVTGSVDFVLVITVTSMKEYEALSQRLFMQNPNVKKFVTMVALNPFKLGLELPVE